MSLEVRKIGVWGLGNHALKNIIPAIISTEGLDLLGVFSRNKEIVSKCCKSSNCRSWDSAKDMLLDPELDIVFLSTPPSLHLEQGIEILKSNKHLWCEKPFTTSYSSSKDLLDMASGKNLSTCEGLMYLYHPHFLRVKEIVNNKVLGDIKTIICRFGLPKMKDPGFRFNKELGGSCLFDVGCYPISAILSIFSNQKIKIVDSFKGKEKSEGVDVEGKAHLIVNKKTHCFLEWSYNSSYRNEIDIWGSEGSLYTDKIFSKPSDYVPHLQIRDDKGGLSQEKVNSNNHFKSMLLDFLNTTEKPEKLDSERNRILNLAGFLDKIKDNRT